MAFSLPSPLCFLFLLALQPFFTTAQTHRNISLGSSLSAANGDRSSWASPSGDFAFGFQQIGNDGFLLAIWFNKLPDRTIVWSANRNNLVQVGSTMQLTTDGQLVLRDHSGGQIWNPTTNGVVAYAAMLDTGNFVLASRDSVNLWQSFDEPTDTILPTQILSQGAQLVARYTQTNFSNGRFKLMLQVEGDLHLYTTRYPFDSSNVAYWPTASSTGGGDRVIFNQSGYIYLAASNGSIVNSVFSVEMSTRDFYQRAIMEYDGVFRHYVYPKSAASSNGRWPMAWSTSSFIPSNICTSIIGETGGGACGFNSYCSTGDDQTQRPSCQCPPGYVFLDPNDHGKGCKQNFVSQNCDEASQEIDLFDLKEMSNTDWPLSDYEYFGSRSEDWCRQACLIDCYCAVAIFRNGDCWKKKTPLSNGKFDASVGGKALIKVRKNNFTSAGFPGSKNKDRSTLILTGSVFLGSSIFLNVLLMLATYVFFSRLNQQKRKIVQPCNPMAAMNPRRFTFCELEAATGGFKEEVGSGAFGTVYKGILPCENDELIAVKKLEKMVTEGELEFKTEVRVIGGTNHKNLVRLLGFCNEGEHRLLVYEYMSNGSLSNFLLGDSRPNWHQRIQIAFGIARGLFYLHEECSSQIIHCDIKPQNILLDESLAARISDFGLAKLLKTNQTRTTTGIRGTKGYVAPEWFKNMPVTVKVDVYSFGIVLLELICCRKNFEPEVKDENRMILQDWAYDCYLEERLHQLVEDDPEAMDDIKRVEKFVRVSIWCIQEDPSFRPTMKKVLMMLEGAVEVPIPPDPASFISTI